MALPSVQWLEVHYLPQDMECLPLLHLISALFFIKMKTNAVQSLAVTWLLTCQPNMDVHRQGTVCKMAFL